MVGIDELRDPAVRGLVMAINAGDRDAFYAALTDDATMSADGAERNLSETGQG
jgi:hypothetical protein